MAAEEVSINDALNQLTTLVLALAHTQAVVAPDHTLARLGAAVIACRQNGYGDTLAIQIFNKVLPGRELPIVLSEEEFAKKVKEQGA